MDDEAPFKPTWLTFWRWGWGRWCVVLIVLLSAYLLFFPVAHRIILQNPPQWVEMVLGIAYLPVIIFHEIFIGPI